MSDTMELDARIALLENRLGMLEDVEAIKRLQRIYGYYIDNRLWGEMAALFADEGASMEIGRRGRYEGKERIVAFLREVLGQGRDGLNRNEFINHMQLQGVVTVDPDRQAAQGRWRALVQGSPPPGGTAMLWAEGVYENTYVKEDGVWKFARLWWVPTFYVTHPGYESVAFASAPESEALPPQAPSAPALEALGRSFAPFHYRHPITGDEVTAVTSPP
ncbi:nuclear transport factor 2 family protein [Massilia niastensis]|uniref:nuclear transport factor 2 family protein n=1 Tax=Massilia niastensis TaxID=544911 RepID=UPI0003757A8B|nr:nuclear transport factor 2 family protein [Massilia niastensis]